MPATIFWRTDEACMLYIYHPFSVTNDRVIVSEGLLSPRYECSGHLLLIWSPFRSKCVQLVVSRAAPTITGMIIKHGHSWANADDPIWQSGKRAIGTSEPTGGNICTCSVCHQQAWRPLLCWVQGSIQWQNHQFQWILTDLSIIWLVRLVDG